MTSIPLTRQPWCKNPTGYEKHQAFLVELHDYFVDQGLEVVIPEDLKGWDLGRDLTVNGAVVDLKVIPLKTDDTKLVWDSPYYESHPNPTTFPGSLTDYFIHVTGPNVEDWVMGPAVALFADKHDCNPFYRVGTTITVGEFAILSTIRW